jgi:hypothetical protein
LNVTSNEAQRGRWIPPAQYRSALDVCGVGSNPIGHNFTDVRRGRIHRRKNQKGFFHSDANSNSAQKEKICDRKKRKKRISFAFADFVAQKEIRLSIAKRVRVVESEKEILANAGAERNATAIANTFSFVNRDGNS